MKKILQKQGVTTALLSVMVLIITGAGFSIYNKQVILRTLETIRQTEVIKRQSEYFFENIKNMDISGRGYAILKTDQMLFHSPEMARQSNKHQFRIMDSLMALQGYSDPVNYPVLKKHLEDYVVMFEQMVNHLKQGNDDAYKALLSEDRGAVVWKPFFAYKTKLFEFEDKIYEEAKAEYDTAMFRNSLTQWLLVLIGLPTLGMALYNLRRETKNRTTLLLELEENNHQYLFDPGNEQTDDAQEILSNSIGNLKRAADFITQISKGNYQVDWEGLTEQNKILNQTNLVGQLLQMRDQMKKIKQEDEKHLWTTEGLARFSEIIRGHQHNLSDLSHHALVFLTKYLKAQQGSLFVLHAEESEKYLQLTACYAFDRKKFVEKRIEIGQGLIGQTYLEAQTIVMTQLPEGYTAITSGLGDTTPGCLLIVPMKYNDQVQAIVELASFYRYEPHQIAFLEKAGEFVASAIASAQTSEKTRILLEQFRGQTEQLRSQEEEMRQNMEELAATQEEMERRQAEMEETRQQEIRRFQQRIAQLESQLPHN